MPVQHQCCVDIDNCVQLNKQQALYAVSCTNPSDINNACRSEPADDQINKRKRFSDEQLSALTDLADEANWSLLSVAKEVREQFCSKYEISKVCAWLAHHTHVSQAVPSPATNCCQTVQDDIVHMRHCCDVTMMLCICTGGLLHYRIS